ncbi:MAG: Mrp/NBP35 family ATP-binding protein [Deltaproteobacteria bacterium]|nr:Mrp/NBP35 family ATP-binding protein [Deltaproteobacteria bacterium]
MSVIGTPSRRSFPARHTLLFTSGKGGVGKSTIAVNVACALARRGLAVGVLDADVYGPSVPRLLGLFDQRVRWGEGEGAKMIPAENFGVKVMSVGLTTPESDTPLVWRASVAVSALRQMIDDTAWGALDVLVIDAPPGTGDVQLTLAQDVALSGAVVVTTPQPLATDDVRRALRMLREVGVATAGVVENLGAFTATDGAVQRPFGEGGGRMLAQDYEVPLLAELPLDATLRALCDEGRPAAVCGDDAQQVRFAALAARILERVPQTDGR